ncbi:uncharacterized protein LOC115333690 [Aquila chrysaetos chrysaetos]|uniref:uncharacterized protein LOC115333690 n=1 Tax=Aquila chrysaetos chrysaetos TaxID=223781 RepID=UPI00117651AE|nr:uncharacterized protein LOC115333690 [Aquila chrysaetos chrysaetos]
MVPRTYPARTRTAHPGTRCAARGPALRRTGEDANQKQDDSPDAFTLSKMLSGVAAAWQLSGLYHKPPVMAWFSKSSYSRCARRNTLPIEDQKTQVAWAGKSPCSQRGKPPRARAEPESLGGRAPTSVPAHGGGERSCRSFFVPSSSFPAQNLIFPCESLLIPIDGRSDADGLRCVCAQTSYLQFFLNITNSSILIKKIQVCIAECPRLSIFSYHLRAIRE